MNLCDLEGISNDQIRRGSAYLRVSGIVNHFGFWSQKGVWQVFTVICLVACLWAVLIWPWRMSCFFHCFQWGQYRIATNHCVTSAWETSCSYFSWNPCPGSCQASSLPDNSWWLVWPHSGQKPVLPTFWTSVGMVGIVSPFTPSPETVLVIVRQVSRMLSCLIEMSGPTWVSLSFPQAQLKNKETDLLEIDTNQNLLCSKT